jgi:hypothetical protein
MKIRLPKLLGLVTTFVMLISTLVAIPVSAMSGVSVAVTSATNKIDDVGNYNIYATLGTQLTGSTADTITLTLPSGFTIGTAPTLTLIASSGWVTIPPAIVPSFQTAVTTAYASTGSGQTIVITLGAGDYIGAGAQILLNITAGITNPSVAGDYRLTFKTSKETTAITSNAFTIYNPSTTTARTTTTIQSGGAIVVQPATGVSARISGSSAADGTSITVSSIDYGNNQPSGTGTIQLNDTEYYDVNVSSSISLGAGAMAEITIASSSVTVNSTMGYWYGGVWNVASNIAINMLVSPPTITGDIPVSALGGTPIVIGMASLPPAPPAPTPEMPAVALLSIGLVGLVGYAFIRREKTISKNIEE